MAEMNEHDKAHVQALPLQGDVPFLAMFAEPCDDWALVGCYDEISDLWVVDGQPLVTSNSVALETMTFTRAGGESQDRD